MSFKGRVVRELNGKPLDHSEIYLTQNFTSESPMNLKTYGPFYTNSNGNFEFALYIKHNSDESFAFNIYDSGQPNLNWGIDANQDGSFQLIYFPSVGAFDFHIKNLYPVNSNDLFRNLYYGRDSNALATIFPSLMLHGVYVDEHQV